MVARVAAVSKYREKCKRPKNSILMGDPEESPLPLCATIQIIEFLGATGFCQIWIPRFSFLVKAFYEATKSWGAGTCGMGRETIKSPLKKNKEGTHKRPCSGPARYDKALLPICT
jgi:hypothetical protein